MPAAERPERTRSRRARPPRPRPNRTRRAATAARPDRAQRREAIVDAAVAAIRRDGPDVSMEAIAAEAGITKPIVYRHFGDRGGLVEAVAERFVDGLLAEIGTALGRDDAPARELLEATIDAYLAFVERDPEVYRFLVTVALGDPGQARHALGGFIRRIASQVAQVVGERLRAGGLDSGPAEAWAYGMVGMVHLSGDWWLERQTLPRARLVEYLVTLLWDGLGVIESGATAPEGRSS